MMASYLSYNATEDLYHVGPPVAGAAEKGMDCRGMQCQRVSDPTFELTYFRVGLTIANEWRKRLGQTLNQTWANMAARIAPAPQMRLPSSQPPNHGHGAFVSESGCGNGSAVQFVAGQLKTAGGLCLDTAHLDPGKEFQLLPAMCSETSTTQQWTRPDNRKENTTYLHFKSVQDGRCLAVFNGGTGAGVGIWSCGPDNPSGQGWDVDAQGMVTSRDAGSPTLCQAPITPSAPDPSVVYNQNRACTGAYTDSPSLCEGEKIKAQHSSSVLRAPLASQMLHCFSLMRQVADSFYHIMCCGLIGPQVLRVTQQSF